MKKKNSYLKRIALVLGIAGMVAPIFMLNNVETVSADAPYETYTVDGYGDVTKTQTAYLPDETITKIEEEALNAPTDFTILDDGYMYILDSGNKRVIKANTESEFLGSFGEDVLVNPKGIYVTEDHICYVADRDARAIFVFDEDGKLIQTYTRPEEAMYGETMDFLPLKIVVNSSGTMYVICESNTNGIVQISPVDGGTFLGYFGTNATSASLWNIIWRSVLSDAQRAKMISNIPSTPDNLAIDSKGVIYTVTRGEDDDSLKRLNIAGVNMIDPSITDDVAIAVAVGNHDNVFVASQNGYIYEYNNEGDLLFVYGGADDGQARIGLSTKVEAIQVGADDKIYVLDSDKNQIQVYAPTEFTDYLHNALYLFSKGRYEESKSPLTQVLEMNNLYDYANMAMGKALYKEEDYEGALKYARLSKDLDGYSDAFWEIRNDWLKKNLSTLIIVVVAVIIVIVVLVKVDKKKNIFAKPKSLLKKIGDVKIISELKYAFYFIKHPVNACYEIKYHDRVSIASSNIIVVIFMIFFVINKYFCGFLTKTVREGEYNVISDIGMILIVLFVVVACNYLMCSINDGEGKLKHIYCTFIYSAVPYLLILPIVFLLSHVVTNNEMFFIQFANLLAYTWVAVLEVISIKEINDYNFKETVKIILLTVFTILIVALLAFIIYVLWSQVIDFVKSLFGEAVYRIGN